MPVYNIPGVTDGLSRINSLAQGQAGPGFGRYGQQDIYRPQQSVIGQARQQASGGQVLGANTEASSGGGGGDSQLQQLEKINRNPIQEQEYQSLLEQTPQQPSIDYNSIFAPAFEALTQQEQANQSGYEAGLSEAEGGTVQRKAGLESEQEGRLAGFDQQRQEATGQTQSAVEQARRQASELQQGIQARFGGTTGTGRFQSEILGAQATRNIAQNQSALQNTLGKIGQSEESLKTEVTNLINQEDQRLESTKLQLRSQLQQSLADVGREKGRLESEKAQLRINTLNQYQQVLADVNARNTAFKQQLFQQTQQAQSELEKLRSRAQQSYQVNLTPSNLTNFVQEGIVSPEQAQRGQIGTNLAGKSLEDVFGTATGQPTDENALGSVLGL